MFTLRSAWIRLSLIAREGLVTAPDDAGEVLSALRLGWFLAEVRGRNKPGGQLGPNFQMPDHDDHALPLRIERSGTELRIEAQEVVAQLAAALHVDAQADGTSFSAVINLKARLLDSVRAPRASTALQQALDQLRMAAAGRSYRGAPGPPTPEQVLQTLQTAVEPQERAKAACRQALAAAQQALASAEQHVADAAGQPADVVSAAEAQRASAAARVDRGQAAVSGAHRGLDVLQGAIGALQHIDAGDASAAQARVNLIRQRLQLIVDAADQPWQELAELLWRFDAHIQDRLSATSETQACGYQLGRGMSETYWALDPDHVAGSQGWEFLLGRERCNELGRLTGRLGAYMTDYTAPAITGSIEIWRYLAAQQAWRGDGQVANEALYRQIRRWYELIVLGQDPTTLIQPGRLISGYRTVWQAVKLFWPQLVITTIGLGFLVTLIVLLSIGSGTAWQKTLSGILAATGLSLAGLTGTLKNSAQAMLKRLRQDAYTDLVAIAVQTAPPPPKKSDLHKALSNRRLTPATPN
jgi:hypothetical protein